MTNPNYVEVNLVKLLAANLNILLKIVLINIQSFAAFSNFSRDFGCDC